MKGNRKKITIPNAGVLAVLLLSSITAGSTVSSTDQTYSFGLSDDSGRASSNLSSRRDESRTQPLYGVKEQQRNDLRRRRSSVQDHRVISVDLHAKYVNAVQLVLKGSIEAPVSVFGETLDHERLHTKSNIRQMVTSRKDVADQELIAQIDTLIGHASNKLYGGSQYHRAVREMFILAHVSQIMCEVTDEEVAQMSGVSDIHDGPDYLRTVAKLALDKTFKTFESILDYFYLRCIYIMKRMFYAVEHVVNQQSYTSSFSGGEFFPSGGGLMSYEDGRMNSDRYEDTEREMKDRVKEIYERFVEMKAEETYRKCKDDLIAMTHFLSMDLNRGGTILNDQKSGKLDSKDKLHEPLRAVEKDFAAIIARGGGPIVDGEENSDTSRPVDDGDLVGGVLSKGDGVMHENEFAHLFERSTEDLVEHMLEVMNSRSPRVNSVMSRVMGSLIQKLTWGWRSDFANHISTKFNCFFALPFHEEWSLFLRNELDQIYR